MVMSMSPYPAARVTRALALATLAFAGAACSSVDEQTQITLGLSAETEIPKELDSFAIRVFSTRTGELRFSQDYFPTSGREFPTTLAVIPADEASLESPIRVEIEGRQGSKVQLRRQSVVSFFKKRNVFLNVPLRMACFQFKDCGPENTCAGGQCVPARIDPSTLPEYESRYVFGENGRCFDEEKCLGDRETLVIEDNCEFSFRDRGEGVGNVSIRWAAAPGRVLALESDDPQEGWRRIGPGRGRLSQGACDSHFQRRGPDDELLVSDWAKTVYFSGTCPSKPKLLPICYSDATQHSGIGAIAAP